MAKQKKTLEDNRRRLKAAKQAFKRERFAVQKSRNQEICEQLNCTFNDNQTNHAIRGIASSSAPVASAVHPASEPLLKDILVHLGKL